MEPAKTDMELLSNSMATYAHIKGNYGNHSHCKKNKKKQHMWKRALFSNLWLFLSSLPPGVCGLMMVKWRICPFGSQREDKRARRPSCDPTLQQNR